MKQIIKGFAEREQDALIRSIICEAEYENLKVISISAYTHNDRWLSERAIVIFEKEANNGN